MSVLRSTLFLYIKEEMGDKIPFEEIKFYGKREFLCEGNT